MSRMAYNLALNNIETVDLPILVELFNSALSVSLELLFFKKELEMNTVSDPSVFQPFPHSTALANLREARSRRFGDRGQRDEGLVQSHLHRRKFCRCKSSR